MEYKSSMKQIAIDIPKHQCHISRILPWYLNVKSFPYPQSNRHDDRKYQFTNE